ncbi:hypothetical protein PAMP_015279 [Pampus punctatissimus]
MVSTVRAVVCLSLWLAVCQVRGSYIPPEMNKTIQDLLQNYEIAINERFDGNPVFRRGKRDDKSKTNMVYMGAVLETYEKLFGHMLKQLPTSSLQTSETRELHSSTSGIRTTAGKEGIDVKTGLTSLLERIKDLKKSYTDEITFLKELQGLRHIEMDNKVIQSKALWELSWLYEEASSLVKMQRRRRRHARRMKFERPSIYP